MRKSAQTPATTPIPSMAQQRPDHVADRHPGRQRHRGPDAAGRRARDQRRHHRPRRRHQHRQRPGIGQELPQVSVTCAHAGSVSVPSGCERPERVHRQLPDVAVGVGEIARVAAPEHLLRPLQHRRAGRERQREGRVDLRLAWRSSAPASPPRCRAPPAPRPCPSARSSMPKSASTCPASWMKTTPSLACAASQPSAA